jgi:hypothetical protein
MDGGLLADGAGRDEHAKPTARAMTASVISAVRRRRGDQEGRVNDGRGLHHLDRDALRARTRQGARKLVESLAAAAIFPPSQEAHFVSPERRRRHEH